MIFLKPILLVSYFSLCVFPANTIYAAGTDTLKVMTYNIRYDNPQDGINAWANRKEGLINQIRMQKPDVFGIQEGLLNQVLDIHEGLPGYGRTGVGRDDGKEKGEFAAIYYNTSRLRLLEHGDFWLSGREEVPGSMGWDAVCTRLCSWAKFLDLRSQKIFYYFNTHWDHVGKKAKIKSAALIRQKMKQIARPYPVILGGDFNCESSAKPLRILQRKSRKIHLHNCAQMAHAIVNQPGFTYQGFYQSDKGGETIDHIFVSPDFKVDTYNILREAREGRSFSDHLPVIVLLSY